MRPGPAPMPTKLKVLRGERRPSRLNDREPQPLMDAPRMPVDLDATARAVWDRVMETQAPDVILAAHRDIMRLYCEAVVRYEESAAMLRKSGPLMIDRHHGGAPVKSPLHQIVRDNASLVRQLAGDLGLTPSAISTIRTAPKSNDSTMAGLLQSKRRTG